MPMDGRDQELIDRRFDSLERTMRAGMKDQNEILLKILNQLRKERGETEMSYDVAISS